MLVRVPPHSTQLEWLGAGSPYAYRYRPQPAGHLTSVLLGVLHSHGTLRRLNEEDMLCANILALPDVILLSSGHALREATEYPLKRAFMPACCMLSFCRRRRCRFGAGCGGMLLCGHSIPPAWLR